MALQKTPPVFVPLAIGIQSDVVDKLVQPGGGVLQAENVIQDRQGQLVKRPGGQSLTLASAPTTPNIRQAFDLAQFGDAAVNLAVPGANPLNVYSDAAALWSCNDTVLGSVKSGRRGSILARPFQIASNGFAPDAAYGGGFYWMAMVDFALNCREIVVDATTGRTVLDVQKQNAAAVMCRPIICNGFAVYVRTGVGTIEFDVRPVTSPLTAVTNVSFGGVGLGNTTLDVMLKNATTISVVYANGTPEARAVDFVPSTGVATAWIPRTAAGANIPVTRSCAWMKDLGGSGQQALITASTAEGVRVHWGLATAGATRNATRTDLVDAADPGAGGNVTGHTFTNDPQGAYFALYDIAATPAYNTKINLGFTNGGGVAPSLFTVARSVGLRSKSWIDAVGGDSFVTAEYVNGQGVGTRFVLDLSYFLTATPHAIFNVLAGHVADASYPRGLTDVTLSATGEYVMAQSTVLRLTQQAATVPAFNPLARGMALVKVQFGGAGSAMVGRAQEAIGSLMVPGGLLGAFDGVTFSEGTFAYIPEQPTLVPSNAGGSKTATGVYACAVTYGFLGADGRIWRSGPSVPKSVTLGAADNRVTWTVPTLRITGRTDIIIELWESVNGSVATLQKVTQIANVTNADTVTFVDTLSDAAIATGEFAPFTGNVITNETIPGAVTLKVWKNRLWFVSADDQQALYFSGDFTLGQGMLFNAENFSMDVRDEHGPITAIAANGDSLIVFKGDIIYAITGDGPNLLGQGGFSRPAIVASGVGCFDPRAMCENEDGVWFKSTSTRAGIHNLNRGLSLEYIGAGVHAYDGLTVTSALAVPTRSQIRFYTLAGIGRTLVYSTVDKAWSTWINQPTVAACTVRGLVHYARGDIFVMRETDTFLADNVGGSITQAKFNVGSPWLTVAGMKGWERIYVIQGVGTVQAPHVVQVLLYRDFNDTTPFQTRSFTFGPGTNGTDWNWELPLAIQKLTALKVVMIETSNDGIGPPVSASAKITGIAIIAGVKGGLKRQTAATRGSSP